MIVSHVLAVISALILANPVADLEVGVALVELCVAMDEFKQHRRLHGCLHCIATLLAVGLAICAWLATR